MWKALQSTASRYRRLNPFASCLPGTGWQMKKKLTLDMLEGERFVSYCSDSAFRNSVDAVFRKAGVKRQLFHEARTTEVVCTMVSAGLGVSIIGVSESAASARWAGSRKLVVKPIEGAPTVTVSLVWATHRPISAGARELIELAKENFPARKPPSATVGQLHSSDPGPG